MTLNLQDLIKKNPELCSDFLRKLDSDSDFLPLLKNSQLSPGRGRTNHTKQMLEHLEDIAKYVKEKGNLTHLKEKGHNLYSPAANTILRAVSNRFYRVHLPKLLQYAIAFFAEEPDQYFKFVPKDSNVSPKMGTLVRMDEKLYVVQKWAVTDSNSAVGIKKGLIVHRPEETIESAEEGALQNWEKATLDEQGADFTSLQLARESTHQELEPGPEPEPEAGAEEEKGRFGC